MTSSRPSIALGQPHPQAAQHEAEAGDARLQDEERIAGPEEARDDDTGESEADRGEGRAKPEARHRIAEQEQRRPERHLLARSEMPEKVRPDPAEGVEQRESGQNLQ